MEKESANLHQSTLSFFHIFRASGLPGLLTFLVNWTLKKLKKLILFINSFFAWPIVTCDQLMIHDLVLVEGVLRNYYTPGLVPVKSTCSCFGD